MQKNATPPSLADEMHERIKALWSSAKYHREMADMATQRLESETRQAQAADALANEYERALNFLAARD